MITNAKKRKIFERHSLVRSLERFDIILTQHEQTEIKKKIHCIRGEGVQRLLDIIMLEKQEKGRILYAVFYKEEWLPVIYSKPLDCIVTVLPKAALLDKKFTPPRLATDEEQKEAFLSGKKIPRII